MEFLRDFLVIRDCSLRALEVFAYGLVQRRIDCLGRRCSTVTDNSCSTNLTKAKRLSESLADVYATLIGDDKVDVDDNLNAIQRVERAAQVLRLELELHRAQASTPVGLTEQAIADAVKKWFPDRAYQAPFFARALLEGDKR